MSALPRPTVKTQRVIAEREGSGWLVMWPDGSVEWKASKRAVLSAASARVGDAGMLVTVLEWR